ncbi:Hypothetical protein BSUIS_A1314 [Brucella suis ATCC 23445]|uniref:Uncharacterized protein n=1 Tax=Brucella suis (strain ATCC 23445 / NCTC 10510) TaxID=470137 RepID=B0CH61_BRUSI|nr:Hypothetical protein BSUIS_A1314 [Brucella suis ATCC 23445]
MFCRHFQRIEAEAEISPVDCFSRIGVSHFWLENAPAPIWV